MLDSIVDLMLPRCCVGCAAPGGPLCGDCAQMEPEAVHGVGVAAWAGGRYQDGLRAAVLRYKERGRRDLAGVLAGVLTTAVRQLAAPAGVLLVPVPSSAVSLRTRGYDHLAPLAERAGRRLRLRVAKPLGFSREVADSAGLGAADRTANLAGAMRASAPARPGQPVVLVDDVVTTGATAREACRALGAAGWTTIGFAAVAATPRADTQLTPLARTRKAV